MTPVVSAPSRRSTPPVAPAAGVITAQRPELLVVVQRDWNGWRKAMAPFGALQDVHWHQPPGAPRPLIHAFVGCDRIVSGDVPHECTAGTHPHRLRVCVLKCHTPPEAFQLLTVLAGAHEGPR
jgi:hypothetical protein